MTTTTRSPRPETRHGLAGAVLLVGVLFSSIAGAAVTDPFTAHFKVNRGSIGLGTTTFSLARAQTADCYVYSGRANPNALVRVFIGDVSDESRFCIEDDALRPSRFSHHMQGDAEDSYTLDYDWDTRQVVYRSEAGRQETMALGEQGLDPLSIQIAARRWVAAAADPDNLGTADFTLVDEDETKTYTLRARNGGTIDTPAGRYDTLLVERVDDDKRHLRFWLARNADWIPVRVEHQKGNDGIFRMSLTSLDRPGARTAQ